MKKIYLLAVMVLSCVFSYAQAPMMTKGDKAVNLGLGLGTFSSYSFQLPPIVGSFDYVVKDNLFDEKSSLSVGAYGQLGLGEHLTYLVVGARGAVHYNFVDKLDTYAGLMLGYSRASVKVLGVSASTGAFGWSTFIGARYFFTPSIGAFAELGYGTSALEAGVTFKF